MNEAIFENRIYPLPGLKLPSPGTLVSKIISRPPPPRAEPKIKKPSGYLRLFALTLVGAACGFFGIYFGKQWFVPIPGPKWIALLTMASLPLVWLFSVGVHEFGHVVGGWLGGGKFLLWQVGPLMVRRTPAGIRASWNRIGNFSGGLSACVPLDPARATPRRDVLMTLGGPVANLMLTVGALWFAIWLATWDHPLSSIRALAYHLMLLTAFFSFLILLVAAVPSAVGGFKSDGKRVLELLRGGAHSEQQAAMLVLTSASLGGIRPSDYNPALVAKTISLKDGSLYDLYGHFTVYFHAADRGDWSAAQAHLDHALAGAAKMTPFVRDILRCEYAWLLATQSGDASSARAWLDSAGKLDIDPATRLRAEAAVLLAEGKNAEATTKAREGLHALKTRSVSPTEDRFAVDALEKIIERAAE